MSLYIFIILIAIVAFLLILIIMVQNPKGGGLDSSFGGGGGAMLGGVQQTSNFLDKATWYLFGLMVVLILISNSVILSTSATPKSQIKEAIEKHIPTADETAKPMPNPMLDANKKAKPETKK